MLLASGKCVGVGRAKVDAVRSAREIGHEVTRHVPAVVGALEDEAVGAVPAPEGVAVSAAHQRVAAFGTLEALRRAAEPFQPQERSFVLPVVQ